VQFESKDWDCCTAWILRPRIIFTSLTDILVSSNSYKRDEGVLSVSFAEGDDAGDGCIATNVVGDIDKVGAFDGILDADMLDEFDVRETKKSDISAHSAKLLHVKWTINATSIKVGLSNVLGDKIVLQHGRDRPFRGGQQFPVIPEATQTGYAEHSATACPSIFKVGEAEPIGDATGNSVIRGGVTVPLPTIIITSIALTVGFCRTGTNSILANPSVTVVRIEATYAVEKPPAAANISRLVIARFPSTLTSNIRSPIEL
jgi:hypothetical protein